MTKERIIGTILTVILIISLITGSFRMFREGVFVDGGFYYKVNDSLYRKNFFSYITRHGDDTFKIHFFSSETTVTIHVENNIPYILIKYPNGTTKSRVWTKGFFLSKQDDTGIIEGIYNIYTNELESVSSLNWQQIIIGIIPYIVGAVSFLYPEEMDLFLGWRQRWYYKFYYNTDDKFELSDNGRRVIQFSGVIAMIFGLAVITGSILL